MDLRHLHSFVVVAEELSFQRAATRLHLSQPPLSRRIKALEKEVGVRLLNRSRNSQVSLTDAGHAFLAGARQTLASADGALRHARETVPGVQGRLNLANIAALSTRALPPLLQAFHAEYPQVEVFLLEMERAEQTAALREGRIHVGLFPDLGAKLGRHFQSQPMFSCPMVAVLPAEHDLAKGREAALNIQALAGETLLIPLAKDSTGYVEQLDRICKIAHFNPAAVHPVAGVANLLGMVAAGYGVAVLPEVLVSSSRSTCQTRRLRAPVPSFKLKLVWLRDASSPVLRNFLVVAERMTA